MTHQDYENDSTHLLFLDVKSTMTATTTPAPPAAPQNLTMPGPGSGVTNWQQSEGMRWPG